ncbi:alpha/beta hydrolase [Actinomadura barringtoniae]|uniref:Alpha/beta hydrolase n=1 Tax=Actinomadura barringtoniae TaxID=1427535 RepID=A0A939PDX7_9ACTN|nr:alpha/beta hydrolase [Actinomadura barringtoniae]MBO2450830.1 alpha/beta hydrolase [Actinomadura barringtoniae]
MLTTVSADGTDVRAYDEGEGPPVVIVGPGMDDGSRTKKLASLLTRRFRVLRLQRRQYRLDLKAGGASCSIAQEAADVLSLVRTAGEPVILYGHSSGGVVALEALAASPDAFAGAVIFEPAAVIGPPLGGAALGRARAAEASGRPGKALAIFMREVVGMPAWQATPAGVLIGAAPRYRRLVPSQLDDLHALDELGVRLDAYAQIPVPTVLLGGDRSPAHLAERLDAIANVLPNGERVVMHKRDHSADLKDPQQIVRIIDGLADDVL